MPDEDADLAILDFWPDGEVLTDYYQSWAPNSLIMGPYGSGKSKTTAAKLLDAICMMPPNKMGVRQSRTLVTRNYEADLKTTSIEDWLSVLPGKGEGMGELTWSSPIIHKLDFIGIDGIPIQAEIEFLPLNNIKEAQKKLKGKEYTFGWFNECGEQPELVVTTARGRIGGRYPRHQDMPDIPINEYGDRYWSGAFYDTNPPDDESWVYQVIETPTQNQKEMWATFVQPPGAFKDPRTGRWFANDKAENLNNLSPSYYHERIANALSEDWLRINIGNQYGTTLRGIPVWSNYSQTVHETETMDYDPKLQVWGGMDYGRTPAISFWQKVGDVYLMFDEFTSKNMSAELFGPACRTWLWEKWKIRSSDVHVFDDPSGGAGGQATEDTPRKVMRASGFQMEAAPCDDNDITTRRKAMTEPLGRLSMTGHACVQIHARCRTARKGAAGKFYYRQLEVSYDDMYSDKPIKNFYSHLCEGMEYFMVGMGEGLAWADSAIKPRSGKQRQAMVAHRR